MQYALVTFGCRVNQADSVRLEGALAGAGAIPAEPTAADVVVVNTCSVTATADQAARQAIRRIARLNPSARIVATGCYASRCPIDVAALPGVARVIGNDAKDRLVELIGPDAGLSTDRRFGAGDGPCGAPAATRLGARTALALRLQTGCEESCTYCIIPRTRGRSRSLPVDDALMAVRRAVARGFKEIVLVGVHLGAYGRDLEPAASLATLVRSLVDEADEEAVLFRLSSIEPMDCELDLVDLVASRGCCAPHFHLPLQHASDTMLAAMGRPYTRTTYAALVDRIRALMPDAAIGSDVIAGFPGETEADFACMLDYLGSSPLTHLHVFPYSSRPGTEASRRGDSVDPRVVRERARQLRATGRELARRFRVSQVGRTRRALTLGDGRTVVTDNYLKLDVAHGRDRNQWVSVRVRAADEPVGGDLLD